MIIAPISARALALLSAATLSLAACGSEASKPSDTPTAEPTPVAGPPAIETSSAEASSQPPPPLPLTRETSSDLTIYVDKYPFDKVNGVAWNDHPAVKAGIAATVKDAKIHKAITTLEGPAAPIELRSGKVMSWACQAHNCGPHQWSVHIDPGTGATDVCYFDEETAATEARWFLANGKEEKRAGNCQ